MKTVKMLFTAVLAITLVVCFTGTPLAKSKMTFGFKLSGGLNYATLTDYNNFADDWNTWLMNEPDTYSGAFENFHLLTNFGGEFVLYLTPNIGIGLGVGYLMGSVDNPEVEYGYGGWLPMSYTTNQDFSVSAIPIKLTFHYVTPVSNFMNFFFNAGVGYYLGTLDYDDDGSMWLFGAYTVSAEASMNTVGFHGGIGLEFKFSPSIGFFIQVQGVYAQFSGITGDYSYNNVWLGSINEERTLYHYVYTPDNTTELAWRTAAPSGTNYSDVREANFDLTGVYFGGGFIFRFGGK